MTYFHGTKFISPNKISKKKKPIKLNSRDLKKLKESLQKLTSSNLIPCCIIIIIVIQCRLYHCLTLVSSLSPSQYQLLVKILGAVVIQSIPIHAPCSYCYRLFCFSLFLVVAFISMTAFTGVSNPSWKCNLWCKWPLLSKENSAWALIISLGKRSTIDRGFDHCCQ